MSTPEGQRLAPRFGPIIAKLVNLNSTFRRRPAIADDVADHSGRTSDSDSESDKATVPGGPLHWHWQLRLPFRVVHFAHGPSVLHWHAGCLAVGPESALAARAWVRPCHQRARAELSHGGQPEASCIHWPCTVTETRALA